MTGAVEQVTLPLLGRIAAAPDRGAERSTNHLEVPSSTIGNGEHFALEIVGDSMTGVGILEGDTVLIQRANTA